MKARIWFQRQLYRFLNLFAEVRELRKLRIEYEQRCREVWAKELEHRKQAEHADIERAKAERLLADANRALEVMTEARLNADHAVDVIRGQMETLRETSDREIASMKNMVDWFGLEGRGRQVFGTAPLVVRPKEETDTAPPTTRVSARHLVQQQAAENLRQAQTDFERFMREAEERLKRGEPLPNNGAEYSSTSRAVEEPVAQG